ncbi:MAG: energy transducer TonB [Candidatus Eiseniibacteriota bacterium]
MRSRGRTPAAVAGLLVLGALLAGGAAPAATPGDELADPARLVARARDIQVERRTLHEATGTEPIETSAQVSRPWLERLVAVALRESGRSPSPACVAACRRCPDQLSVDIRFDVDSRPYVLTLHMREGLAFLRGVGAQAWSFEDSLGVVLGQVRQAMRDDRVVRRWTPPSSPPTAPDVATAAHQDDDVLLTGPGMPEPLRRIAPSYPEEARERNVTGVVQVRALVRTDGAIERARVSRSVPLLDQAALDAVRQWRFKPAICGGRPVAVWVTIPVRFSIH